MFKKNKFLALFLAVMLAFTAPVLANMGIFYGSTNLGPATDLIFTGGLVASGQGSIKTISAAAAAITSGTIAGVTINSSAIGGTTPAAGAFTTLSASSTLGVTGAATLNGDVSGDGGDQLVGFLKNVISTTNPTLTVAQCGSTITNTQASTAVLPEASTAIGCRYTFIVGNASNFGPNPADGTDQIVLLTNAAGDSLLADAVGESVTIEAVANDVWAPVGAVQGTWTDSN